MPLALCCGRPAAPSTSQQAPPAFTPWLFAFLLAGRRLCIWHCDVGDLHHCPPHISRHPHLYSPYLLPSCVQGDAYAFGIVMWETFTGASPYPAMAHPQIMVAVVTHDMRPRFPDVCPEWYKVRGAGQERRWILGGGGGSDGRKGGDGLSPSAHAMRPSFPDVCPEWYKVRGETGRDRGRLVLVMGASICPEWYKVRGAGQAWIRGRGTRGRARREEEAVVLSTASSIGHPSTR